MSTQLDTGTGTDRRRLTLEEAERGDNPMPFTREEWDAMHVASAHETQAKFDALWNALWRLGA